MIPRTSGRKPKTNINKYWESYVICVSCLGKPQSIYSITKAWRLNGNPLTNKKKGLGNKTVYQKLLEMGRVKRVEEGDYKGKYMVPYNEMPIRTVGMKGEALCSDSALNKKIYEFISRNRDIFYNLGAITTLYKEDVGRLRLFFSASTEISGLFLLQKIRYNDDPNPENKRLCVNGFNVLIDQSYLSFLDVERYLTQINKTLNDRGIKIPHHEGEIKDVSLLNRNPNIEDLF